MKRCLPFLLAIVAIACACLMVACGQEPDQAQEPEAIPKAEAASSAGSSSSALPSGSASSVAGSSSRMDASQSQSGVSEVRDYAELQQQITDIAGASYLDSGISFVDLQEGVRGSFSVNGDAPLVAASMVKLLVMAAFLDGVDRGKYSMEETYTLQASDIVGGTGSLQGQGAGYTATYAELARLMVSESDNVAANVLINMMGMDEINAEAGKLGLKSTRLSRLMMDEEAIGRRLENFMSANDVAALLTLVWKEELVSPEASRFFLEALEAQADGSGIKQGIPPEVTFAHKTGNLATVRNDGGIVEAAHPYVLVVMCSGTDDATALSLMGHVSGVVYSATQDADSATGV